MENAQNSVVGNSNLFSTDEEQVARYLRKKKFRSRKQPVERSSPPSYIVYTCS